MENKSKLKKNIFKLLILTVGAAAIYGLPYFRYAYWDTFMNVFNLTDKQMASLQSIYGIFALVSYLPGGWLADRVSVKKLLLFSLFSTAITGLWLSTVPSFQVTLAIHGFWGISTILTFWPAFIKAVRSLANDDEQGKAYGIMEGSRGVINIIIGTSALAIFGAIVSNSALASMQMVIYFYCATLIATGIGVLIFIKDVKVNKEDVKQVTISNEERKAHIVNELKRAPIWIISGIVFCSYFMNIAFYNFTPYAQNVLKAGPVLAGFMTILAQWVRPISSISAGVLGDKISISKTVRIGFILMTFGTLGVMILPIDAPIVIFMIFLAIIYVAMYSLQANHYALMEEGKIHKEATGTAVGIISTLGYLPEVVAPIIVLAILTKFGVDNGGTLESSYDALFLFLSVMFIVGIILTVIWNKLVTKKLNT